MCLRNDLVNHVMNGSINFGDCLLKVPSAKVTVGGKAGDGICGITNCGGEADPDLLLEQIERCMCQNNLYRIN